MKRFYKEVDVRQDDAGWQVVLDGRPLRTQKGALQSVPTQGLAQMLAAEWRAQGDKIDLKSFVYRDMADFALDMVAPDREATIGKLLNFAETDTLCYRAARDDGIFQHQQDLWEPLVAAYEKRHSIRMERASGVIYQEQPAASLDALGARLQAEDDFTLAGLLTMASLAASLIVALAVLDEDVDPETLFAAANAEEDWQAELWGWDHAAEDVRATRMKAFVNAAEFVKAARA